MDLVVNGLMTVTGLAVLYGLASAVKPFWVVRRRWQAGAVAVAGFVVFGLLSDIPASRPADVTPQEWARRMDICRAVSDVRNCPLTMTAVAQAQERLTAKKVEERAAADRAAADAQLARQTDPATPKGHAAMRVSFRGTQEVMLSITKPCDEALLKAAKSSGRYANYGAATRACKAVMMKLGDLKFGAPLPDAQKDLNAALQCFQFAYGDRASAMDMGAKLMDAGDPRPSQVSEYRGSLKDALQRTQECALQYAAATQKHGLADAAMQGTTTAPRTHR